MGWGGYLDGIAIRTSVALNKMSTNDDAFTTVARTLSAASSEIDYISLALVLLQAVLLYRIACIAQDLSGDRLIAAAKLVKVKSAARAKATSSVVQLDELTAEQRAMLERVRSEYRRDNGELDDLWEPFLLRYLVHCGWKEAETLEMLRPAAAWRREHGAAAIRQQLADGWKVAEHECVQSLFGHLGVVLMHGRAICGDVLTIADIGSLDADAWMEQLTDDEFADVALHLLEALSYHADALSVRERVLVRHAFVMDYEELGWSHLMPALLRRLYPSMTLFDAYYPELVGSILCVHVRPLFVHLWGVLQGWLSVRLRGKVTLVTPEATRSALVQLAAPSQLPSAYGGMCDAMPRDVRTALGFDELPAKVLLGWPAQGKLVGYCAGAGGASNASCS